MMCTVIITTLVAAGSLIGAGWVYLFHHPATRWGSLSVILFVILILACGGAKAMPTLPNYMDGESASERDIQHARYIEDISNRLVGCMEQNHKFADEVQVSFEREYAPEEAQRMTTSSEAVVAYHLKLAEEWHAGGADGSALARAALDVETTLEECERGLARLQN